MQTFYKSEAGRSIQTYLNVDITGGTSQVTKIARPDGTTFTKSTTDVVLLDPTQGVLETTLAAADFLVSAVLVPGAYIAQSTVVVGTATYKSAIVQFLVEDCL